MTTIIDRVQALIAKAESSPYPAEADAFMNKAQQLINDHAIDQARLKGVDPSTVGHEAIPMMGTYTKERSLIWGAAADANRCKLLTLSYRGSSKITEMTLIGRADDRDLVRLVAASLELQALRRMNELDPKATWETPVVQRRSFLRGFAIEVADRLSRSGHTQVAVSESTRQVLVLAAHAVDRYVADHFDVAAGRRSSARHDGIAYSQGRRAGANADVGSGRLGNRRRGLPSG